MKSYYHFSRCTFICTCCSISMKIIEAQCLYVHFVLESIPYILEKYIIYIYIFIYIYIYYIYIYIYYIIYVLNDFLSTIIQPQFHHNKLVQFFGFVLPLVVIRQLLICFASQSGTCTLITVYITAIHRKIMYL